MTDRNKLARRALTAFLFLTGGSALVYQVLWSRYLSLLLGSSAVAVVVVLAAFMGGLAVGSWAFGRMADRPIRRLTLYAWLEMGVGIYCAVFPGLLRALEGPYLRLVGPLYGVSPGGFTAARLLFAALLLVPPTILMGGTMPAASRFLLGLEPGIRKAVARLYWVNSLGAVIGALLAGFWMIPALGLDLSMDLAALVNILVGVAAIALRSRIGEDPDAVAEADPAEAPLPARAVRAALIAVTVSGFAALVVEVAWTRLLALVLGSSTYAFTLMVSTFILGIALGSRAIAGPRFARFDPVVLLGTLFAAVAVLLAVSIPLYPYLPWVFRWLRLFVNPVAPAYPFYQATLFAICLLVMLVPTVAMGATLPLASRISSRDPAALGGRIGLTWALNTTGTLLGALLGGLVFLPRLGLQRTFLLVTVLYAAAAALAFLGAERRRGLAGLAVALAVAAPILVPRWGMEYLAYGEFRLRSSPGSIRSWKTGVRERGSVPFHEDGPSCSVSVFDDPGGSRNLRVNGKPDASDGADMPTQLLAGHIPALLAPREAKEVLVVGVGSGATIGALSTYPNLKVTAVEIEPAVVKAARLHFAHINEGALQDHPRVRVLVEDAKTIFQAESQRYDVIVSEPSNPWVAGIGGLFTKDFFEKARSRLLPGGLVAQWMHTYEMDDESVRLVLRTFRSVFPNATAWRMGAADVLLVATDAHAEPDLALLETRIAIPEVRRSLERINLASAHAILARQILSPAGVAALAGNGPVNSDQFPILEYAAPRAFFVGQVSRVIWAADERVRLGGNALLFHRLLSRKPFDHDSALTFARSLNTDEVRLIEASLRVALRERPTSTEAAMSLAKLLEKRGAQGRIAAALEGLQPGSGPAKLAADRMRVAAAMEECRARTNALFEAPGCEDAERLTAAVVAQGGDPASLREDLVNQLKVLTWMGKDREALALSGRLLEGPAGQGANPQARAQWLSARAISHSRLGDATAAAEAARQALGLDPTNESMRRLSGQGEVEPVAPRPPE